MVKTRICGVKTINRELTEQVTGQARRVQEAAKEFAQASAEIKDEALLEISRRLEASTEKILSVNDEDLASGRKNGLSDALLDRLELTEDRIAGMAAGLKKIVDLEDPIGEVLREWKRPNGLRIGKRRVPLGVVGIIYEARPNVTIDVAGLCLKSGNGVVLRGGSEAFRSNQILTDIIGDSLEEVGLSADLVQLIQTTDREAVNVLLGLNEHLDVLIPRGGPGLIDLVVQESSVPAIQTGVGNCHVYVDDTASLDMALDIVENAKTDRPAVCNAAETTLVHKKVAPTFLPRLNERIGDLVELRGCEKSIEIESEFKTADESDWGEEYLDYVMAIKVVESLDEALNHIDEHGTKHSESVVTQSYERANRFLDEVDAAAVYVNASTRFTDGGQFGLGAETGISTQKLHARGPMGLRELTTTKYVIRGSGQTR